MDLSVKIGKLRLRNPFILASGILSHGSLLKRAAEAGAGAVVTKSLTLEPREGYPTPTLVAFEGGFVNAMGLPNPGCEEYLKNELPLAKEGKVPVIVSLAGSREEEFGEMAEMATDAGADGLELNLSCPHAKRRGLELGQDPAMVRKIVRRVKSSTNLPIWVKLGLCDSLLESALVCEQEGAEAVVAINTLKSVIIDVDAKKPVLSNIFGGLSGPALRPIAVRCVFELYERLSIPIIGSGGVLGWRDAVEFMLAGASAVQVGSAVAIRGVQIFKELCEGLTAYLRREGISSPSKLIGLAHG
jgi:dihydroorotate dehydrogenase (NAD+) catalytic subunit